MLVILPFERDFYRQYGMDVDYVGHPLLDVFPEPEAGHKVDSRIIALLPGSRQQEIQRILPAMLATTRQFPDFQFVVAGAASLSPDFYAPYLSGYPEVQLRQGDTYALLREARAALVKSGTSTLETALIGVPQVVCYAGSPLSFAIARRVVNVAYISLVNLILNRELVRELIQDELTAGKLTAALREILEPEKAEALRDGYRHLRHILGDGGASERAAQRIVQITSGN